MYVIYAQERLCFVAIFDDNRSEGWIYHSLPKYTFLEASRVQKHIKTPPLSERHGLGIQFMMSPCLGLTVNGFLSSAGYQKGTF
jgi:hypothetical protein